MATTGEHRTIAPIVGPDDPRRFTDSGIEVKPLYTEEDLPAGLPERLGEPGSYPYTRGIHREMYQAAVDDAPVRGLRQRPRVQRALSVSALQGLDRPVDGLRFAHPAGARLR